MTRTFEMKKPKDLLWYCFELVGRVANFIERLKGVR